MLPTVNKSSFLSSLEFVHSEDIVVTLHRPSNVDDVNQLEDTRRRFILYLNHLT